MPTRRTILQLGLLAGPAALWKPSFVFDHRRPVEALAYELFFGDEALPAMRERFDRMPLFAPLRQQLASIDRAAERRFIRNEVRYNDHLFHMRLLSETAWNRAFYHLMTGDEDAADLAVEAIRSIMKFPRWDYYLDGTIPIGFQRASKAAVAVSVCVDWLADRIEASERSQWIQTMGERGCEACYRATYGMRYPERVEGWRLDPESTYFEHRPGDRDWDLSNWPRFFDNNNLKAEPASALAIGALAFEQEFGPTPDTERWIEQAVYSIGGYRHIFKRDGSYNEGISYAGATATHLFQAYSVLSRFRNTDFYDQLNWPGFMDYAYGLSLPTREDPAAIVNFSDAGNGLPSAVPFWIASRSRDPEAQWFAEHRAASHTIWSAVWFDEGILAREPEHRPTLWQSDLEWIVSRTGHRPEDLTVAMRSGPPFNHEHADRNSILIKCFGEQLVVDPNRPPYTRTDPGWIMRGTVGHSGVLIDGNGHQYVDGSEGTNASEATASLVRSGERKGCHFWASDATPAYQLVMPDVASITRTVLVLHQLPAVILVDKVIKTGTPSRIQARFFGYNLDGKIVLEARENRILISRPYARLQGIAFSPSGLSTAAATLPMPEETAARYPFAEISTGEAMLSNLLITVLFPMPVTGADASADIAQASSGTYRIAVRNGNQQAGCTIFDTGNLPEFALA